MNLRHWWECSVLKKLKVFSQNVFWNSFNIKKILGQHLIFYTIWSKELFHTSSSFLFLSFSLLVSLQLIFFVSNSLPFSLKHSFNFGPCLFGKKWNIIHLFRARAVTICFYFANSFVPLLTLLVFSFYNWHFYRIK